MTKLLPVGFHYKYLGGGFFLYLNCFKGYSQQNKSVQNMIFQVFPPDEHQQISGSFKIKKKPVQ